ncbi:MAG: nucleotidyltransferase domain-containing protein [bacterium]|nr:nucleotidyltransferase domain-containing protein [bacterium]
MRLDRLEREALKFAFKDFKGNVFLFGSRTNDGKKGGDIDLIVIPSGRSNFDRFKGSIEIQKRFFSRLEQNLDVIVYDKNNPFCKEMLKNAQRLDFKTL